jgi:UDP-N-acetylmuramoyl-tripeptide--D-alanyl-D-alanine ligase
MEAQTLNTIAKWCNGRLLNASPGMVAENLSTDSRAIERGDIFVAISGEKYDAHDFLADVCAKGAVAAVIEENRVAALPPNFPAILVRNTKQALGQIGSAYRNLFELAAVAIAGSNGKTSTKELVAAVLGQKLKTVWSPASFNNDIGVPLTLLKMAGEHEAGVLEIGTNHPGELQPLIEMIRPSVGVITSIGREHLEYFGSIEGVLAEEGMLAEMLPAGGLLVINGDGYGADELLRRSKARVVRVGIGSRNDWRIGKIEFGASGSRFEVETDGSEGSEYCGLYETKLLGSHQVVNATYAIVVGKELGLGRA